MSCTECGRCQDVCPAYATGKELSPKLLIMGLRDQLFAEGPQALATARRRVAARAERGHRRRRVGLRDLRRLRPRVPGLDRARRPHRRPAPPARDGRRRGSPPRRSRCCATSSARQPVGEAAGRARRLGARGSASACSSRASRPPEVLYWVGCAASFDERARARRRSSTTKLLLAAGLDVAILGPRESCTGDPARRMGNEYVFQSFAEQNVATLERGRRDEDRRELPALLQHARERVPGLRRPLRGGAPHGAPRRARRATAAWRPPRRRPTITYHDSCYLARHNDVLGARASSSPRIGKPLEMARSGKRTFCCGAGGAHMWMEERGTAINEERAREAAATGAGHARRRVPVLHGDARRRRAPDRARAAGGRRLDAARRGARARMSESGVRLRDRRRRVRRAACSPTA